MQKITHLKHDKHILFYGLSCLFERAGYYGIRACIVLYLTSDVMNMSNEDTLSIYGTIFTALIATQILGALLGDLVMNHKKAILLGGIMQAIGTFIFCIPSVLGVYVGLGFLILGAGFYKPNMIAEFGKLYRGKEELLDAGFTVYYGFINVGAFIGTFLLGYIGEEKSWSYAFILGGVFFIISTLFLLRSKNKIPQVEKKKYKLINKKIFMIITIVALTALFWMLGDYGYGRRIELEIGFRDIFKVDNIYNYIKGLESLLSILGVLILSILWSWYYSHQLTKLLLGFVFGAVSFGVLFLIPQMPQEEYFSLFIVSLIFMAVAEAYIAPVVFSIFVKYSNPKYLATLIALSFILIRLFSPINNFFADEVYENPLFGLNVTFFGMLATLVLLTLGFVFGRKYLKDDKV